MSDGTSNASRVEAELERKSTLSIKCHKRSPASARIAVGEAQQQGLMTKGKLTPEGEPTRTPGADEQRRSRAGSERRSCQPTACWLSRISDGGTRSFV